jgi:hypothetical protein
VKIKTARFTKSVAVGLALAQWLIFFPGETLATNGTTPESRALSIRGFSTDVSRILSVLENRIDNRQLLERTKDKLLTLDPEQIRLIASLSDRVVKEENTAGSEIAFLLMTALITLI